MSTTIFTAEGYDPAKARKRRQLIITIVSVVVIVGGLLYIFRNWPYEHRVDQFFSTLEAKDYEKAYGMWVGDPDWKQHPDKHPSYPYNEFYRDWGPASPEWGIIRTHHVEGSAAKGSGVIVVVKVNDRVEEARLWVEKKDKTLTWSPY